ncbi:DUF3054 domain-containing protein [Halopiger djelfimassiliensis]|uniref:DUF3054 domain-containing protein n=1 Tax=Halopiger djelfimassiliensis TaxID=1293047 RepID=UPI000677E417|nr:DUF3054 domain-containing protein [Halopiger djelfimassiliensis]
MDAAVRTGGHERALGRETLVLGLVDVGILAALILFGRSHHYETVGAPLASLETITPFVIGWIVVALLSGLYTRRFTSVVEAARTTAVVWIAAANVGLILRSSPAFEGSAVWPFGLVITGFGLLVLVGWRVGYTSYVTS